MISAIEALSLPTAQLTEDELTGVYTLEAEIESFIRKCMEHRGIDMTITEVRPNVIAEVNQRLKAAKFAVTWYRIDEPSKFDRKKLTTIGYNISISPTDAAYQAAKQAAIH